MRFAAKTNLERGAKRFGSASQLAVTKQINMTEQQNDQHSSQERLQTLIQHFRENFSGEPTYAAYAPGRVNLIGEHTDYNDGYVLPIALTRNVCIVLRPREDDQVKMYSSEYDTWSEFKLSNFAHEEGQAWGNYLRGIAWALQERGHALSGFEGVVSGNVPRGSGLSSSAALEIATAAAFLYASDINDQLTGTEVAELAQRAENEFVGVNCGIMDQFISVLGAEDHALLLDCRSLDYELIPVPPNVSIVIGNTKASRSLANSAYNERRAQCESGVATLQTVLPEITALRDISSEQLEAYRDLLEPLIYQRCHHVVTENERVLKTVEALRAGDLTKIGKLMSESHHSLRDDYEVSSDQLDAMVNVMAESKGCFGARLTGAGFGGCAIALVEQGNEQTVADAIFSGYSKETNIWPEVYTTRASVGARVYRLSGE